MTQADEIAGQMSRTEWSVTLSRFAPLLMLVYLGVQLGSRLAAPGGLGLDEAEQMVTTQSLELGYGPQPPLYTWLQMAVFQVTGEGKLGLALFKHGCLAAIYLGIWVLARQSGANRLTAAAAMFGTMFLPSVVWEAQRALTHSVLATALAVWSLVAVTRAARTGALPDFCLAGVLVGLGLMSKWTFGLVLLGVLAAVVLTPALRTRNSLIALAIALVIIAAPAFWAIQNWSLTTASAHKLELQSHGGVQAVGAALSSLGEALASTALVALVVFLAVFRTGPATGERPAPGLQPVEAVLIFGILGVAAVMLLSGATSVKERWMQPIMIFLPLVLSLRLASRITASRMRWFLCVTAFVAVGVSVAYPLNLRRGQNNPSYQSAPFAAAAQALDLRGGLLLVSDAFLAGNLRYIRPDLAVLTPELPKLRVAADTPSAVVWWARDAKDAPAPQDLRDFAADRAGVQDLDAPKAVSLPYPAPHEDRTFNLFQVEVPS